ncbi:hypothetical protein Syun_009466 [Stephania yunnanensis]|uniref:Pectin acetylesterase n=1 Tax=Stephania yunnanensis TaxID=152371 RepID=A0AAP0KH19_9MAGN
MPVFQDGSVGGFLAGSPFFPGVMAADGLIRRSNYSGGGASTTDISYHVSSDPRIMRSVSVHGWSSGHLSQSLPCGQALLDQASLEKSGGFTICSYEAGFKNQMLDAIKGVSKSNKNGLFINSCFAHCHFARQDT